MIWRGSRKRRLRLVVTFMALLGSGMEARDWVIAHLESMEYPRVAAQAGTQGVVTLECRLSDRGEVMSVNVVSRPSRDLLARAAVANVKKWRFRTIRSDAPMPATVRITYTFRLEGECAGAGRCRTEFQYDFPDRVTVISQRWRWTP